MASTGDQYGALTSHLGREPELEHLQRRLEAASNGLGSLVLLSGPGGSGTTRTAHELAARADRLGMLVLWGRTRESTRGRAYSAMAGALAEYALDLPAEVLAGQLAGGASVLTRLVPGLGLALRQLTPAAPLEAADERLRLYAAVHGWLQKAAVEQPLLLVLDDFQWADLDSLQMLDYISRRLERQPLLLLVVGDLAHSPVAQPLRALAAEVIELGGLDEGATAAALAPLADRPISEEVIGLVQQVTGGEPLWARELFRFLSEENRLDAVEGRGVPAAGDLPETLEQLVAWRISRWSPEVRSALVTLAAFDEGAGPALVADVSGLSRSRSVEFLEAAARAGLCRSAEHGQRYLIAHDRLRPALLATLSPVQRAQLHRRAAEALEAELGTAVREQAGELLFHYRQSATIEGTQRGVRHGLLAAEQARAAYAHRRAADCLEASLELVAEHDRPLAAELSSRLGLALAEAGLTERAADLTGAALRSQRQLGARSAELLEPLISTLRVLRGEGPLPGAQQATLEDLRRLGLEHAAGASPLDRARLELLAEGWQPLEIGELLVLSWSHASGAAQRALRDADKEADQAELLLAQRTRSREESSRAAGWARSWRRPQAVLRAMRAVALDLASRHGLLREAAAWAGLYQATAERYGAPRDRFLALCLVGRCQAVLGHFEPARQSLGEAAGLHPEVAELDVPEDELLLSELVLAHYLEADWPPLVANLAERQGARPAGLLLAAELSHARARAGDEAGARQALPDILAACAQLPPLSHYRDAALLAALASAWQLGAAEHSALGRRLLDLAIAGQVGSQPQGSLRLAKARLLGLSGDVDEARTYFAEERPLLDELGLRPLRALLDHDEALVVAAAGPAGEPEAARLLESATSQFEELGMSGWLARTQVLLETGFEEARRPGGRLHFTYPLGLSRREADMVRLVSGGLPPGEAAGVLELDEETAQRHLAAAQEKLQVSGPEQLPAAARRHGLGGGG